MSAVLAEWGQALAVGAVIFAPPAVVTVLVANHGDTAVRAVRAGARHAAVAAALWLAPAAAHAAQHSYYVPGVRHG